MYGLLLALALLAMNTSGFAPQIGKKQFGIQQTSSTTYTTSLGVFGQKKTSPEEQARLDAFWQGDWVCKDCGYIYNRGECAGMFFGE
tara:strand:- start:235 stop:495 length:261 start_codon:yes stop_codon:yes gene_type:complete